jgi:monoamine oxidase
MRSIFARLNRRFGQKIPGAEREAFVRAKLRGQGREPAAPARPAAFALDDKPRPKVAIIGGGFAGLMAGYALSGHAEVTVFEARNRVGGRVWSRTRPSGLIEAGGELIGYNHPLWLRLARRFELGLSINTSDTNFDALTLEMPLFLDGHRLSPKAMEKVYDEMKTAFDELSRQAVKVEKIDANRPWLAKNAAKLDAMPLSDWIASQRCSRLTRLAIAEQFTSLQGATPDRQSYLANLAAIAGGVLGDHIDAFFTQSEAVRCSEGNGALAEHLAAEIKRAGGAVRNCCPVHSIRINDDNVALEYRSGRASDDPEQACVFAAGDPSQNFTADYVVLAIPPSLWPAAREPQIAITPELPRDYYISMGTAVKYLSQIKHRFWIGEGLAPNATSSEFGVTWEGTDNQIAPPGRNVALNLFAAGPVAQDALNESKRGGKDAVDRFYSKRLGAIYPGYAPNLSGEPDFMAWPDDPWTRAGYSCPAPGEVTRAGPLLEKAFRKRLFFAGEHTCFAYFGYMEGALQSGRRAASAIRTAMTRQQRATAA